MLKLVIYSANCQYMFPNGSLATGEIILQQFPAVGYFTHVLEVNGNVCQAVQELGALRAIHGIDEALSDQEAIAALEAIINTPPTAPEPSAEERIAAAMEFQNLMNL